MKRGYPKNSMCMYLISSSSSSISNRAFLFMSLLVVIGTMMVHVADACRCIDEKDPCAAMLDRNVLVRGIVGKKKTAVDKDGFHFYSYDVILETVYVNANGLSDLVEGQTIQIRVRAARNSCDISQLPTDSDMLLDLYPQSNGEYFSTHLCAMNSPFHENGVLDKVLQECFSSISSSSSSNSSSSSSSSSSRRQHPIVIVQELKSMVKQHLIRTAAQPDKNATLDYDEASSDLTLSWCTTNNNNDNQDTQEVVDSPADGTGTSSSCIEVWRGQLVN
mmetsp:Transcript_10269/g.18653  ORF Transcript_10269/g.18653 Transcript_10269/m.18653 type:complete len:276 (-) Transcript_10269:40-867(-)